MCNSEASPNPSSTPSSVHGLDLPPPGELDQLRREASLGRPATREEIWKKTHMKLRNGKEVWVETRAVDTYGRAYGFCSEKNFHRLQCGLQGIGGSATMLDKQLEETRQEIRELARKYEEERKEGWMSSDVGRHLSQTSKNSSLK
ncbi:hypothetical protein FXO37_31783 [Capsicum annuum]|nr:hypothetical protein FXO37_31783 [Capsicum annuum]